MPRRAIIVVASFVGGIAVAGGRIDDEYDAAGAMRRLLLFHQLPR